MTYTIAQVAGDNLYVANQTTLHPVGVSALVIALAAGFLLPRRHAAIPLVALIAMIPSAQRVVIATLDFNLVRLMILGMLFRITVRSEWAGFRLRAADYLLAAWAGWSILANWLLWDDPAVVVTRTGYMIESVGAWVVARALLRDFRSFSRLTRFCAWLAIVSVAFFLLEQTTKQNLFSVFGGVPSLTMVRDGRLRCQGPFSHPIMAGIFWASLLPLFCALGLADLRSRWLMIIGSGAVLTIVVCTASSTPAMAVLIGIGAMALYPVRRTTPLIRFAVIAALPALHVIMDKGVHHLLARINIVGGSTGWHRYHLMDGALHHIAEWAALGTKSTRHWGWGLEDVTNQYLLEGVRGGLPSLLLFAAWIVAIFVMLSRAIRRHSTPAQRLVLWACGSMLFAHCLNFIAVSIFGQMTSAFYMFAAMSACLAETAHPQHTPHHQAAMHRESPKR